MRKHLRRLLRRQPPSAGGYAKHAPDTAPRSQSKDNPPDSKDGRAEAIDHKASAPASISTAAHDYKSAAASTQRVLGDASLPEPLPDEPRPLWDWRDETDFRDMRLAKIRKMREKAK